MAQPPGARAGTKTVQQAFKESTAIFAGRMIAEEYRRGIKNEFAEMDVESRGKNREYEVLVYRFAVTRWYKGDSSTREAILVTDNVRYLDYGTESIPDCGLGFKANEDYLIYAYGIKMRSVPAFVRSQSGSRRHRRMSLLLEPLSKDKKRRPEPRY